MNNLENNVMLGFDWSAARRLAVRLVSFVVPLVDFPRHETFLLPAPWAWATLGGLALITAIGFHFSSMHFVMPGGLLTQGIMLFLLIGGGMACVRRGWLRLAVLFQTFAFLHLVGLVGRSYNYLVVALNLPYVDPWLQHIHTLTGFDWQAHVVWINGHPLLAKTLVFAYESYKWLMPLTAVLLIVLGKFARLREYLLLMSVSGFITASLGALLPAMGAYGYLGFSPAGLENIPLTGTDYLSDMEAVRNGALTEFNPLQAVGLTTIPSYHTIMALFLAWAWRGTWLQWPVWVLSALTIAATPAMGGHYLIDLLAGVMVFWAVLKLLDAIGAGDPTARSNLWCLLPASATGRATNPASTPAE